MKHIITLILIISLAIPCQAQFTGNGKIYFERQTNLKMSLKYEWDDEEGDNSWRTAMLEKMPKYETSYFIMSFNENKSDFIFDKDEETKAPIWSGKGPARENHVITNYTNKTIIAEKEIYETKFIVADSFKKFTWKIQDEIREIAGYPCRKATTTICDSVVVVAFYTDQILVSGGPESFNGLPGMILGLAIPRLYTTWYATKVDLVPFEETQIKEPKKGKRMTQKQMDANIGEKLSSWGKYGTSTLWWTSL